MIVGLAFSYVYTQILTGETPFRRVRRSALAHRVLQGERPEKPEKASAIGFSDSLWVFTQRCWDGEIALRPKAGEVVTHLDGAVASWHGLMPPCPQTGDPASDLDDPDDPASDAEGTGSDLEPSESGVLVTP